MAACRAYLTAARTLVQPEGKAFRVRRAKDPRDLRILDPACGSGHFLLYAFDLLLEIYDEAGTSQEKRPGASPLGGRYARTTLRLLTSAAAYRPSS